MYIFTPKNERIQSFFRELQVLLLGDEPIADGTNDKPLDVPPTEPVHDKSLESSKSKSESKYVAPREERKEPLKDHTEIRTKKLQDAL